MMCMQRTNILLAEDSPYDLELTLMALKKCNLDNNVHTATDGEEALDFIFSNPQPPHLKVIFLDLKLPKINGLEVLRKLKADNRTKTIPVVVLTSSQHESDLAESYELGVNSYVVKPVRFDEFVRTISGLGLYWVNMNKLPAEEIPCLMKKN